MTVLQLPASQAAHQSTVVLLRINPSLSHRPMPLSNPTDIREIGDVNCYQSNLLHLKYFLPPFPALFETPHKLLRCFDLEPVAS